MKDSDPIHVGSEQVAAVLHTLKDGTGLRFIKNEENETCISLVQEKHLVELSKDSTKLHVVSMMMRTGAEFFYNHLEYTYFPPMTPENDEYDYLMFKWHSLIWVICSIPIEKKPFAEASANEAKMRLADGIPIMVGPAPVAAVAALRPEKADEELSEMVDWFPLNSPTTFALENTKEGDISVYEGKGAQQDLQAEYDYKLGKLYDEKGRPR